MTTAVRRIGFLAIAALSLVVLAGPVGAGAADTTTTVASPVTTPRLVHEGSASFLTQGWAMWIGVLLVAASLALATYLVAPFSGPRKKKPVSRSLYSDDQHVGSEKKQMSAGERIVDTIRTAATGLASRVVEKSERTGIIDAKLDRAGVIMRAGEFVAATTGAAVAAAIVFYLWLGPAGILIGAGTAVLGAPALLNFLASRRNKKFADQLGDTLMLMAGALRSGLGIGTAIDSVGQEFDPPMGAEFQRAMLETRLGREMEDALEGIAKRVQNEDFEWVVDAMRIHRQVGGDLAQILDQVAETIRGRTKLRRQIDSLTAEGRMSGLVLGMLPPAMGLIMYTSNPEYLEPLYSETMGQMMLGASVLLLVSGALWLKKLISVEL